MLGVAEVAPFLVLPSKTYNVCGERQRAWTLMTRMWWRWKCHHREVRLRHLHLVPNTPRQPRSLAGYLLVDSAALQLVLGRKACRMGGGMLWRRSQSPVCRKGQRHAEAALSSLRRELVAL